MVGVDTHRDEHALAVVDAPTGALIAQATTAAANARGYAEALRFADRHAPGARVWAVEGTGHYGAGLVRAACSAAASRCTKSSRTQPRRAAAARQG